MKTTAQIIDFDRVRAAKKIRPAATIEISQVAKYMRASASAEREECLAEAIYIGRRLIAVKASLKHGEFMPWVKANCLFSHNTARMYMNASIGVAKASFRNGGST